jgi:hypothetical protein
VVSYADVSDVIDLFPGTLDDASQDRAERLLEFASNLLRQAVPSIDARVTAGTLEPDLVRDVTAMMVVRALLNPAGAKSRSETVGPSSLAVTLHDSLASGAVFVSAEDLRALAPPAGGTVTAGSIQLGIVL